MLKAIKLRLGSKALRNELVNVLYQEVESLQQEVEVQLVEKFQEASGEDMQINASRNEISKLAQESLEMETKLK